jgi:hypothetical protein
MGPPVMGKGRFSGGSLFSKELILYSIEEDRERLGHVGMRLLKDRYGEPERGE